MSIPLLSRIFRNTIIALEKYFPVLWRVRSIETGKLEVEPETGKLEVEPVRDSRLS